MRRERSRLDELLVIRGLAGSRNVARGLIMAGKVDVGGMRVDKAGAAVAVDANITVRSGPRFVSRGGEKLAGALAAFDLAVEGRWALDVGASTGGFVDCLLQSGAAGVVALDVGHGQLDVRLRTDPRVEVLEGVNARYVKLEDLPYVPDLLTMDVSFISVRKVLGPLLRCMAECFEGVLLIKPQFEAGPAQVGKRGIVRDPRVHRAVVMDTGAFLLGQARVDVLDVCRSEVRGVGGNVEFFYHIARGREKGLGLDRLEQVVERCVRSEGQEGAGE
jgi:23S rRNA (cytidine1920-2'-O)/16S rRNA (cytidine1409-2'-O)-methyltransferase